MQFRWGSTDSFNVSNAISQGGISSPLLFNLDDSSGQLIDCETFLVLS